MKHQAKQQIGPTSRVVTSGNHVAADLGGQSALLDLRSGVYFTLDATGTFVWDLIQTPHTVQEVTSAVAAQYGVNAAECEKDLLVFLRDLHKHGLVAPVAPPAGSKSAGAAKDRNGANGTHRIPVTVS